MRLLLINTCGQEGVVGLAEAGLVVAEQKLPGRAASESLVPAVRALLGEVGWALQEMTAVGVVTGPGSFTGVRVGLSVAKGLCEAGGLRMVAMSRLALVAAEDGGRVALLDAGRGEYFGQICAAGRDSVERLMTGAEARSWVDGPPAAATCEARVVEALGERVRLVREPETEAMLRMTTLRIEAGQWSDVALTDAHYLRRTDAELLTKLRAAVARDKPA